MNPIEPAKIGQPSEHGEYDDGMQAQHFIDNWRQLVVVLKRGELRPGHLKAVKAA